MAQIHRKHLIYGQNCLKERLSGLLGVAHSRVIRYMENRAAEGASPLGYGGHLSIQVRIATGSVTSLSEYFVKLLLYQSRLLDLEQYGHGPFTR